MRWGKAVVLQVGLIGIVLGAISTYQGCNTVSSPRAMPSPGSISIQHIALGMTSEEVRMKNAGSLPEAMPGRGWRGESYTNGTVIYFDRSERVAWVLGHSIEFDGSVVLKGGDSEAILLSQFGRSQDERWGMHHYLYGKTRLVVQTYGATWWEDARISHFCLWDEGNPLPERVCH